MDDSEYPFPRFRDSIKSLEHAREQFVRHGADFKPTDIIIRSFSSFTRITPGTRVKYKRISLSGEEEVFLGIYTGRYFQIFGKEKYIFYSSLQLLDHGPYRMHGAYPHFVESKHILPSCEMGELNNYLAKSLYLEEKA